MPSHFARYIYEKDNKSCIEDENGFVTYFMTNGACYIEDIYVVPEKRRQRVAGNWLDQICEQAKKNGMKCIVGQVKPSKRGATESIAAHLAYGFKVESAIQDLIFFVKEV